MIFAVQMSICLFVSLSSFLWQSLHGHQDGSGGLSGHRFKMRFRVQGVLFAAFRTMIKSGVAALRCKMRLAKTHPGPKVITKSESIADPNGPFPYSHSVFGPDAFQTDA